MAGVLGAIRQYLAQTTTTLVSRDTAHTLELVDDDPYRHERDEAIVDMRALLVSFRSTFTTNYSPEVASAYGLGAPIADDANLLVRVAANVEKLLRTRALTETPWSTVYPRTADTIAALFALAGRDELANAVRPTARRRAGLPETPDAPEAPLPPAVPATPTTGG